MEMEYLPKLENCMTVADLIEELKNFDPEMRVAFSYNYGDYGRTQVVHCVRNADEERVRDNAYTRSLALIDDKDEGGSEEEDSTEVTVLVLSS
jgi:hypothetical protein